MSGDDAAGRERRLSVLLVSAGEVTLAIEAASVGRIAESVSVRRIPRTPSVIAGVGEVDGEVTVVVDTRAVLVEAETPTDGDRPIVRLDRRRDGDRVGLLVDAVDGFDDVAVDRLVPVDREPDAGDGRPAAAPTDRWFRAAIEREDGSGRIGVLDAEYLLQRVSNTTEP